MTGLMQKTGIEISFMRVAAFITAARRVSYAVQAMDESFVDLQARSMQANLALSVLGSSMVAIGSALSYGLYAAAQAADSSRTASLATAQVAANNNIAAESIERVVSALREQYITSSVAYKSINALVGAQLDYNMAVDLAQAAQNLSAEQGEDLIDVYERLIKGVSNASTETLGFLDASVSTERVFNAWAKTNNTLAKNMTQHERRMAVFEYIMRRASKSAGAFDAVANSLSGALFRLRTRFTQLGESMGRFLLPYLVAIVNAVRRVIEIFSALPENVQRNITLFLTLSAILLSVTGTIAVMRVALQPLTSAFHALSLTVGDFVKSIPRLILLGKVFGGIVSPIQKFFRIIYYSGSITAGRGIQGLLQALLGTFGEIIKGAFLTAGRFLMLASAIGAVTLAISILVKAVRENYAGLGDIFKRFSSQFGKSLKEGLVTAATYAVASFRLIIEGIGTILDGLESRIRKAVKPLVDKDLGFNFSEMVERFFVGGARLMGALAGGIIQGFAEVIQVVATILNWIADRFIGASPPPEGPLSQIDEGGRAIIEAWLSGMSSYPLDAAEEIGKDTIASLNKGLQEGRVYSDVFRVRAAEAVQVYSDVFRTRMPYLGKVIADTIASATGSAESAAQSLAMDVVSVFQRAKDAVDIEGYKLIEAWVNGMLSYPLDKIKTLVEAVSNQLRSVRWAIEDALYAIEVRTRQLDAELWPYEDRLKRVEAQAKKVTIPLERQLRALRRQRDEIERIAKAEREQLERRITELEKQEELLKEMIALDRERLEFIDHELFMEGLRNRILRRETSARALSLASQSKILADQIAKREAELDAVEKARKEEQERLDLMQTVAEAQLEAIDAQIEALQMIIDAEEERVQWAREELELAQARQAEERLALEQQKRYWDEQMFSLQRMEEILSRANQLIKDQEKDTQQSADTMDSLAGIADRVKTALEGLKLPELDASKIEEAMGRIRTAFTQQVLTPLENMKTSFDSLSTAIDKLDVSKIEEFVAPLKAINTVFLQPMTGFLKTLQTLIDTMAKEESIFGKIKVLSDAYIEAGRSLGEGFVEVLTEALRDFDWTKALPETSPIVLAAKLLNPATFIETAKGMLEGLWKFLTTPSDWVGAAEKINQFAENLRNLLIPPLAKIGIGIAQALVDSFVDAMVGGPYQKDLERNMKKSTGFLEDIPGPSPRLVEKKNIFETIALTIQDAFSGVSDSIGGFDESVGQFSESAATNLATVETKASESFGKITSTIESTEGKLDSFISTINVDLINAFDAVKEPIEALATTIETNLTAAFAELGTRAKYVVSKVKDFFDLIKNAPPLPDWLQRSSPSEIEQSLMGINKLLPDTNRGLAGLASSIGSLGKTGGISLSAANLRAINAAAASSVSAQAGMTQSVLRRGYTQQVAVPGRTEQTVNNTKTGPTINVYANYRDRPDPITIRRDVALVGRFLS